MGLLPLVQVSSLNRHALATQTDVGISKATVLQQHLAEICPRVCAAWCHSVLQNCNCSLCSALAMIGHIYSVLRTYQIHDAANAGGY